MKKHFWLREILLCLLGTFVPIGGLTLPLQSETASAQTRDNIIGRGVVSDIAWHPLDELIAVSGGLGVWLYTPNLDDVTLLADGNIVVDLIDWNADGSILAGSSGATIRLWNVMEERKIAEFAYSKAIPDTSNRLIQWSPSNTYLLAVCGLCNQSLEDIILVFDPLTGNTVAEINPDTSRRIWTVGWSPDERYVAFGTSDGTLYIYDLIVNEMIVTSHQFGSSVSSIAWHPGGDWLAVSSETDNVISVWNAQEFDTEFSVQGQNASNLEWFSESVLIFRDFDSIKTLNVSTQEITKYANFSSEASSMAWNSDHTRIISVSQSLLETWDVAQGLVISTLSKHTTVANDVAWSPDGHLLAVAYRDPTRLLLIDALSKQTYAKLDPSSGLPISSIVWSNDSRTLIVSYNDSPTIDIWDISSESNLPTKTIELGNKILAMSLHLDDEQLLIIELVSISDVSTKSSIINITSSQTEVSFPPELNDAYLVEWGPLGDRVSFVTIEGNIELWDMRTLVLIETITLESGDLESTVTIDWSFDSEYLAGISCPVAFSCSLWLWKEAEETVQIEDLNTITETAFQLHDLMWLPQQKTVSLALDNKLYLYHVENGAFSFVNEANDQINGIAWHPSAEQVAVASEDGTVRIWAPRLE